MLGKLVMSCAKKCAPLVQRNAGKITGLLHDIAQGPITGIDDILLPNSILPKAISIFSKIKNHNKAAKYAAKAACNSGRLHP